MCGIAGLINDKNISASYLENMVKQLGSRGPDYKDIWIDQNRNFSFVHTRLSILDLTTNGNQPMRSNSGNLLITFNGEIYNHMEIRNKIGKQKKISWKSSGDTETILEAVDLWGVEETLKILDGMFAFCIFDYKKDYFYLARDKFGEKPLYYGWNNEVFIFGSDLNILKNHTSFDKTIDYLALNYFLKLSYIPSPFSIFKNM
jgi:asparagine synthase (glutamine-hydrolysing)